MSYQSMEFGRNGRPDSYEPFIMYVPFWVAKALSRANIAIDDWTDIKVLRSVLSISDLADLLATPKAIRTFGPSTCGDIYTSFSTTELSDEDKASVEAAYVQGNMPETINSIKEQLLESNPVEPLYEILITKTQKMVIIVNKGFNFSFDDRDFTMGFISEYIKATLVVDNPSLRWSIADVYSYYINLISKTNFDILQ